MYTEINILEDDLLRSHAEEERKSGSQTRTLVSIEQNGRKDGSETAWYKRPHLNSARKRRSECWKRNRKQAQKQIGNSGGTLIAALAVAFGVMQYNHSNSVSYPLKKATSIGSEKLYQCASVCRTCTAAGF